MTLFDTTVMAPEPALELEPEDRKMDPPSAAVRDAPADNRTEPPTPEDPEPTRMLKEPARPLVEGPVLISIAPLLPLLLLPEET